MPMPAKYVQPVHFEDFDGTQFERLVFAYHARVEKWRSLEWYGQSGSDLGRDVWGVREDGETVLHPMREPQPADFRQGFHRSLQGSERR